MQPWLQYLRKKYIPNKCCSEITKFSKIYYHILGLFITTTPNFILTIPEFFKQTKKFIIIVFEQLRHFKTLVVVIREELIKSAFVFYVPYN
ncbi:hypothetical protein NC651_038044 [Populus alba x Populus x berolinensis]|nr:hypothetical protein NC651_038044 [Populus alba x Populus x berolinensis]